MTDVGDILGLIYCHRLTGVVCSVQGELLQSLFTSLQQVASDSRPEVRNSAVRTLFAVISSTGGRMQPDAWETCLWGLLFPLLGQTFHMAATSSRDESEAAELGKVRLHTASHSPQPQWEQLVLAAAC